MIQYLDVTGPGSGWINLGNILYLNPYLKAILGGDSLTKPPFGVTSAEVVINWPDQWLGSMGYFTYLYIGYIGVK